MPSDNRLFTICETVSGIFAEICDHYAIDSAWLSWQFERAIWTGETSPIRIKTNDGMQKRPMEEGVHKVSFEMEFDAENPNDIKCIRFTEMPSRKVFLVTQTSMAHVREDKKCPLWIELPPAARKEDIGAVVALLKVDLCCKDWKDSLPKEPHTALERAHLVVANEDKSWLKKQVIHKDLATRVMSEALEAKATEIDELKKEIESLQRQLEEQHVVTTTTTTREMKTPSPPRKKARKLATPRTQTAKTSTPKNQTPKMQTPKFEASQRTALPNSAPANYETRHLVPAQTPTRLRSMSRTSLNNDDDDDLSILYEAPRPGRMSN